MARIGVVSTDARLASSIATLVGRFGDRVSQVGPADDLARLDLIVAHQDACDLLELLARCSCPVFAAGPGNIRAAYAAGVAYYITEPAHPRELLSQLNATLRNQRRIVSIGGGAGLYTLLLGLKVLPRTHLTSVVTVSDDGGSSGRIREAYGVLPPGDIRRSLVALSTAPELMNELFKYRFPHGDGLRDHNLGNLLLTAVAQLVGSNGDAVRAVGDILNVQGTVLPVCDEPGTLCAQFADGSIVKGEHKIDVPQDRDPALRIERLWLDPPRTATAGVIAAILAADVITLGPGDLFTSVLAALAVDGVSHAVATSRARTIYICNLMTKPGETSGYSAGDHVGEIIARLGDDAVDDALVSTTKWSGTAVAEYARLDQHPVAHCEADVAALGVRPHTADIGSERELVRHDSTRLAAAIAELIER